MSDPKKSWKVVRADSIRMKKEYKAKILEKKLEKQKRREEQLKINAEKPPEPDHPLRKISTISIAVPGSILENAQSMELRTYLAGQIARAACIFQCDEIIVFDDNSKVEQMKQLKDEDNTVRQSSRQLARILQYLECPQYLRKFFFPIHKDLQFSGLLNPLDAPHHLRQHNKFQYREGVVTNKPAKESKGSYVNIGLLNDCLSDKMLAPGLRVTVRLDESFDSKSRKIKGKIVSPKEPRSMTGIYWGYTVRCAKSLSDIFAQSPFEDGYDLTIGTSDKGRNVNELEERSLGYQHVLIVFGGLHGLEQALENDDKLQADNPQLIFDQYLNVVPGQGSRTIRTEEAILIALTALQEKFSPLNRPNEFKFGDDIAQSDETQDSNKFKKGTKRKITDLNLERFD